MTTRNDFNCTKLTCTFEKSRYEEGLTLLLDGINSKIKALKWNKEMLKHKSANNMLYQLNFLQVKRREFIESLGEFEEESEEHWNSLKQFLEIEVAAFEKEARLKIGGLDGEWAYFISKLKKS